MSNNVWTSLRNKFWPEDTRQQICSTGDAIINNIWIWAFFWQAPSMSQLIISLGFSLAVTGISFTIPHFGNCAGKTRNAGDYTVFCSTVLISIYMSLAGSNMSFNIHVAEITKLTGSAVYDYASFNGGGWFNISGEKVMFWMLAAVGTVLSVMNGYYPFMKRRCDELEAGN